MNDTEYLLSLFGLQDISDKAAAALNASTFILSHDTLFSSIAEANSGVYIFIKNIFLIVSDGIFSYITQ